MSTAVQASAVARVLGIKTDFVNLRGGRIVDLPMRIGVVGQGNTTSTYPLTKQQITSATQAGDIYGYGSPIHLAVNSLLPPNGRGVGSIPVTVYPLNDGPGAAPASGSITPDGVATVAGAYTIFINNINCGSFSVLEGDSVDAQCGAIAGAISTTPNSPVTATNETTRVDTVSKWEGTAANDITVEVVPASGPENTFTIVDPAGGAVDPDIQPALDQIGNVWETLFVNCIGNHNGTEGLDVLDAFQDTNEGRWLPATRRPFVACYARVGDPQTLSPVPNSRSTDRTNVQLTAPGSTDLPFVIAAAQVAQIAIQATANAPHDYGGLYPAGLTAGPDSSQWTYADQQLVVSRGSSTALKKDGRIVMGDTITMYHPSGDPTPAYRYVVDVIKVMNILFNTELIFASEEWDGAPLIPDNQSTINPTAKQPKAAKAAIAAMIDSLALNAIISDPETAKQNIMAEIDSQNPKRLNATFTVQLSGNVNIISVDFNFGFYFGAEAA